MAAGRLSRLAIPVRQLRCLPRDWPRHPCPVRGARYFPRLHALWPLFVYGHAAVFAQSLALIRPRLQPLPYRVLGQHFLAHSSAQGTLLAFAVGSALGVRCASTRTVAPIRRRVLGRAFNPCAARRKRCTWPSQTDTLSRRLQRHRAAGPAVARPLSIVQISDPHLGPFMSVTRLRRIAETRRGTQSGSGAADRRFF